MSVFKQAHYGGQWWPVTRANWSDRRKGLVAAASARQGYLRPPHGEGKVIWIKAGNSPDSVLLACELLGALRERRLDIRLALTFEHDYRDIIEPRVRGLRKIGLGYGPSDRPGTVRRVMHRLNPLGLILVDTFPHPNLLQAASKANTHLIAFNTQPTSIEVEAAYPVNASQEKNWRDSGMSRYVAKAADPLSLFVESQIDTTLRSLVAGVNDDLHLWWWHDDLYGFQGDVVESWRTSALAQNGVLFLSGKARFAQVDAIDLPISQWDRNPLPPGTVIRVDDPKWYAAVSSAVTATYLDTDDRNVFWQALAGGTPITAGHGTQAHFDQLSSHEPLLSQVQAVFAHWSLLLANPQRIRQEGDSMRRMLWDERRRVKLVIDDYLDRIFFW